MNFTDLADDPEDSQHTPAERIAAATRSTWVSVGVNLVLTVVQITIGIFAKSQALIADGKKQTDAQIELIRNCTMIRKTLDEIMVQYGLPIL